MINRIHALLSAVDYTPLVLTVILTVLVCGSLVTRGAADAAAAKIEHQLLG